ncbi:MAG: leucine-rich repeat domain-containing protein [Dysgonamonadaceae bacterium]|jgi:hypothetical protein|nr:leucine-rich repeat domain-containing protein [Dysgonamonadaceae bacterium]
MKRLLYAATMLLSMTAGFAQTWNIGYPNEADVIAILDNETLTISGTGSMQDFGDETARPWFSAKNQISSVIISEGVTNIGFATFAGFENLVHITLPNSLLNISGGAFHQCRSLESITFPGNLQIIAGGSFYECDKLTSVNIPENTVFDGGNPFPSCRSLAEININYSHGTYISVDGVVYDREMKTLIAYPGGRTGSYKIPAGVEIIASWSFEGSKISDVIIPRSVKEISGVAFHGCSELVSFTVPEGTETIGGDCFYGAGFRRFTYASTLTSIDGLPVCHNLKTVLNRSSIPQYTETWRFHSMDISTVALIVPRNSRSLYEAASGWQDFGRIIEYPRWQNSANSYPNTLTITAIVDLDGLELQSDHVEIAAFCGDECRGSVMVKKYPELSEHFFEGLLVVHGNEGEDISLRVYDYEKDKEYSALNEAIIFSQDNIYGNPDMPYVIHITDQVTQQISLGEGWSWISANVNGGETALIDQFKQNVGDKGVMFKSFNEFIQAPYWVGDLAEINNREMYMINTVAAHTLSFYAFPVNPSATPISLQTGWNWIGYTPQFDMPLTLALSSLNPQDGDQIKSQNVYANYTSDYGWIGSLARMNPGEGYKYYSSYGQTLIYPSSQPDIDFAPAQESGEPAFEPKWTANKYRYSNNMTLTCVVFADNKEWQNGQIEIGAFCGDECRGAAVTSYVPQIMEHNRMVFLIVYGEGGEEISLKIYDHAAGKEYSIDNRLTFTADAILGSPLNPYHVETSPTGIISPQLDKVHIYQYSGNLFIRSQYSYIDQVEISGASGQILFMATNFSAESIDVSSLTKGVYILKLTKDGQSCVKKFVKI